MSDANNSKIANTKIPSASNVYGIIAKYWKYCITYLIFIIFYVIIVAGQTPNDFIIFIMYLVSLGIFTINIFYTTVSVPEIFNKIMSDRIVQLFTIVLIVVFVFKFTAMSMFVSVFDYGRHQIREAGYKDSPLDGISSGHGYSVKQTWRKLIANTEHFENYSTILFLILAFLLYSNQLNDLTRIRLNYFLCTLISIILIPASIMILANGVNCLKIKTTGDVLYTIDPINENT